MNHIFCLQGWKILRRHLNNVAAENYFYRLNEICQEDVEFVENVIIKDSPEGLQESHKFLLHAFTLPHIAKRRFEERIRIAEESGQLLDEEAIRETRAVIEQQIIELNENYHTSIEELLRLWLDWKENGY
jgi:hypothetical protein